MNDLSPNVLAALLGLCVAIVAWLIRDRLRLQEKQQDVATKQFDQKHEALARQFDQFRMDLPQKYVLRDDFIRTIASLDTKMDRIAEAVGEIRENVARLSKEG